jgi:hypothetical protein
MLQRAGEAAQKRKDEKCGEELVIKAYLDCSSVLLV